ncbi:unnamed protein product [Effrenium voratum]|nr:unnamed protein product [Effrenium voratum]
MRAEPGRSGPGVGLCSVPAFGCLWATRKRRPHTARRAAESAENQTDQDPPDTEAGVLAWLEERTGTPEGLEIGTMLFLSKERERLAAAEEVADAMFLALYIRAAQVGTWLGADAWPASFLSKAWDIPSFQVWSWGTERPHVGAVPLQLGTPKWGHALRLRCSIRVGGTAPRENTL